MDSILLNSFDHRRVDMKPDGARLKTMVSVPVPVWHELARVLGREQRESSCLQCQQQQTLATQVLSCPTAPNKAALHCCLVYWL